MKSLSSTFCAEAPSSAARRGQFVYVTSGKGGVGKTMLAANLCARLACDGARVLLVDLDLGLGDADVFLQHCSAFGLLDALRDGVDLAECVAQTAHGFDLLPGITGEGEWASLVLEQRCELIDRLRVLATHYDLVVADGSPGIGADVLSFAAAADRVLLVTTPDPLALADGYGLLKALHERSETGGTEVPTPEIVVNRARDLTEAEFTATRLRTVSERFLARSPRWAGWLPESCALARFRSAQRPASDEPRGALADVCLAQLAKRFESACSPRNGHAR